MINLTKSISTNDFDQVQKFIKQTKQENPDWIDHMIEDGCRDAVQLGYKKIVQLFLDEGLHPDTYVHEDGNSGCTRQLKYFAAKVGNLSIVKLLVSKGAKIKEDKRRFHDGCDNQDAMRAAIQEGHVNVVQYLLENGGNANGAFKEHDPETFLGRAAFENQKHLVDLLVKHGAQINIALSLNWSKFKKLYNSYECAIDNSWGSRSTYDSEEETKRKQTLIEERRCLLQKYTNSVQMILDHAIGTNFEKEKKAGYSGGSYDGLTFLKGLDVTGFNFIGLALDGQPITREMLIEQGLKGADQAIFTLKDLEKIADKVRVKTLLDRLEAVVQAQGRLISEDGVFNLVPLAEAAKKGFLDVVQVRLSSGINPNQVTTDLIDSNLPIVAAAKNGFLDVVQLLAEHPDIDKKTRLTAAEKARAKGYLNIAEYLSSLMDVNEKDHHGDALIHKAVEAKDIAEIERLLTKGADINLENEDDSTPLLIAAETSQEDVTMLEFLLSHGADANRYQGNDSPLYAAAKIGNLRAVELLLPVTEKRDLKHTDIDAIPKMEISIPWYVPLMFDSYHSKEWIEILSLLKNYGADLNAKNHGEDQTLLDRLIGDFPSLSHISNAMSHLEESMVGHRPYAANFRENDYKNLVKDAEKRFTKALNNLHFLLENGADPKIVSSHNKETPLHFLIKKIDLSFIKGATEQIIDLLLSYGTSVNASDALGLTLLHEAARSGNLSAANYLLKKGANINSKSKEGHTPLHLAAAGSPQTTAFLIERGADVNALDEKGLSPIAYSKQACIDNNQIYRYPSDEREEPYRLAQQKLLEAGGK